MREELVTFKTAKLAKEKGFIWKTLDSFYKMTFEEVWKPNSRDKFGNYIDWNTHTREVPKNNISRPTQSLLQKWLREVHQIYVWVSYQEPYYDIFVFKGKTNYYRKDDDFTNNYTPYKSYEEALEIGLQEAFKLIK